MDYNDDDDEDEEMEGLAKEDDSEFEGDDG